MDERMTINQYLEKHTNWKALNAHILGHSTVYHYRNGNDSLQVEVKYDGRTIVTYKGESRTIPNREEIAKALGKACVTDIDCIRIFDQVLSKLVNKHRDDTTAMVQDQMERHAKQQF